MENKGTPDPSRYPSNHTLDSRTNKIKSKWTALISSSSEDYVDHFCKTKVRQSTLQDTEYTQGHTTVIQSLQYRYTPKQTHLTTVIQLAGGT